LGADGIIQPVLAKYPAFVVKRADHDPRPGLIDSQMITDLLNAELVIADLSFQNPNVFYEIGIRHMAQKPIIHLQLEQERVPFDVSLYRAVKYSRTKYQDVEKAKIELTRVVDAVLTDGYQVENPVTNARGHEQLKTDATPEMRLVMSQLEGLTSQVNDLTAIVLNSLGAQQGPVPFDLSIPIAGGGLGGLVSVPHHGVATGLAPSASQRLAAALLTRQGMVLPPREGAGLGSLGMPPPFLGKENVATSEDQNREKVKK
jgi:hypothetical protein